MTEVDYTEIDGSRVVAVIRDGARPLRSDETVEPGQIIGLVVHEGDVNPTWLCEALRCGDDAAEVVVHCMLGQAAAAVWYGPPSWLSGHDDPGKGFDISDTAPSNYDVFGVLPPDCRGPPVTVDRRYIRAAKVRMFVPPPYRRGGCWLAEREIKRAQDGRP